MKDIIIRELLISDLTNESGFFSSLSELAPVSIDLDKAKKVFYNRQHAGVRTIVAVIDDEIVGTASVVIEPKFIHNGKLVGHIEDVAVTYDFQKLGIGKKLMDEIVKIAKENGCYKLVLHCDEDKVAFYKKIGFYRIDGMRLDIGGN